MLERQSEWKALKQMIPAETERAEQREKAIHAKELLEAKGKEAEKALLERILRENAPQAATASPNQPLF